MVRLRRLGRSHLYQLARYGPLDRYYPLARYAQLVLYYQSGRSQLTQHQWDRLRWPAQLAR